MCQNYPRNEDYITGLQGDNRLIWKFNKSIKKKKKGKRITVRIKMT